MNSTDSSSFLGLMLAGLTAAMLGIAMTILARRGRRIDDHPVCHKCGYDLVGRPESSLRCAECGADLSGRRAIRVGNRVPMRRAFWAGLCLGSVSLVMAGVFVWLLLGTIDLMRYKPVWLLRAEGSSQRAARRAPALTELNRRLTDGELSDGQIRSLVSDALVLQADAAFPYGQWQDLTNRLLTAGKIGDEDWVKFVRQAINPQLIARPRIRAGDELPVALSVTMDRLPSRDPPFPKRGSGVLPGARPIFEFVWLNADLAGKGAGNIPDEFMHYFNWDFSQNVSGPQFFAWQTSDLGAGVYTLGGRIRVHVLHEQTQVRISRFDVDVTTDVTVLPEDALVTALYRPNPRLQAQMERAFTGAQLTRLTESSAPDMYRLELTFSRPPMALGHQVFLRTEAGDEFPFGWMSFGGHGSGGVKLHARAQVHPGRRVDVVLRPERRAPLRYQQVQPSWDQELIFHNAQLMTSGPRGSGLPSSTQPGGSNP